MAAIPRIRLSPTEGVKVSNPGVNVLTATNEADFKLWTNRKQLQQVGSGTFVMPSGGATIYFPTPVPFEPLLFCGLLDRGGFLDVSPFYAPVHSQFIKSGSDYAGFGAWAGAAGTGSGTTTPAVGQTITWAAFDAAQISGIGGGIFMGYDSAGKVRFRTSKYGVDPRTASLRDSIFDADYPAVTIMNRGEAIVPAANVTYPPMTLTYGTASVPHNCGRKPDIIVATGMFRNASTKESARWYQGRVGGGPPQVSYTVDLPFDEAQGLSRRRTGPFVIHTGGTSFAGPGICGWRYSSDAANINFTCYGSHDQELVTGGPIATVRTNAAHELHVKWTALRIM